MRTSVVRHPEGTPLVIIRSEFLSICGGDHCAAALLAVFEYHTNRFMPDPEQEMPWVDRSVVDLCDDMLGLYGRTKVLESLSVLQENGFLEARKENGATPTYRINLDVLHNAIFGQPVQKQMGTRPETDRYRSESESVPVQKRTGQEDSHIHTARAREVEKREGPPPEIFTPDPNPILTGNLVKGIESYVKDATDGRERHTISQRTKQHLTREDKKFVRSDPEEHEEWRHRVSSVVHEYLLDPSIGTLDQQLSKCWARSRSTERKSEPRREASHAPKSEAREKIEKMVKAVYPVVPNIFGWQWAILESAYIHDGVRFLNDRLLETLQEAKEKGTSAEGALDHVLKVERGEAKRITKELEEQRTFQRIANDIERDLQAEARKKGFANGQI